MKTQDEKPTGASNCSLSRDELIETNQRLNRRCQKVEAELSRTRKGVGAAINAMKDNAFVANRYASKLRELATHHGNIKYPYFSKCWVCRFRRWRRAKIWNRLFPLK